ncbi:MAG: DUF2156 domain-containing protein [Clostridia bacterium]|nr:DUF2156 domain-containing protein [Clostridia bacterium]
MEFRKFTIDDIDVVQSYLDIDGAFMAERNFVGLFLWCDHYKVKMCIEDDCLYMCSDRSDEYFMVFPPFTRGDFRKAFVKLIEYSRTKNEYILVNSVSEVQKEKLIGLFGEDAFEFEENRGAMDYIYSSEDLMWLRGKKFSAKRNHVNKFLGAYGDNWSFEEMDPKVHRDDIINFQITWGKSRGETDTADSPETFSIKKALDNFNRLGLKGGILRVDGKMVGFTIGKRVSDYVFGVMYEKADISYEGAYAMINQQFAQRNFEGIPYVNREEDLGIEGLRKAKLSYNPVQLTKKYLVKVDPDKIK